tara:strand:+ start:286 stop:879 length:594 start_codon:yes stop_codon:yes gene_type:complete
MRSIILALVLILGFQSWTKADDISDFEIEGMSIGESALDYFSEVKLNKRKEYYKNSNSKTFFLTNIFSSNFKKYDNIMFHFKDNDPAYIIHSISGAVFFKDDGIKNVEDCMIERNKIDKEFQKLFENSKRIVQDNVPHAGDPTGKTFEHAIYYWLADESLAAISCNDYSKSFGGTNHFKVIVYSKAFVYWLNNIAYK